LHQIDAGPVRRARLEWRRLVARAAPTAAIIYGKTMPALLRDELLCEIFAASTAAAPGAIAMSTLERRFTYREVDLQATAIAHGLVERNIGPATSLGSGCARTGVADRADRHRQDRRRVAALRRRRAGGAHRRLPFGFGAKGLLTSSAFAHKAAGAMPCPVLIDEETALLSGVPLPDPRTRGATPNDPLT